MPYSMTQSSMKIRATSGAVVFLVGITRVSLESLLFVTTTNFMLAFVLGKGPGLFLRTVLAVAPVKITATDVNVLVADKVFDTRDIFPRKRWRYLLHASSKKTVSSCRARLDKMSNLPYKNELSRGGGGGGVEGGSLFWLGGGSGFLLAERLWQFESSVMFVHFCRARRVCHDNQPPLMLVSHLQTQNPLFDWWRTEITHSLRCVSVPVGVGLLNRIPWDVIAIELTDLLILLHKGFMLQTKDLFWRRISYPLRMGGASTTTRRPSGIFFEL